MNNISFQSRIRACSKSEFSRVTAGFAKKSVNYPWTVKESVIADKAYTKDVFDCTVCGITDGLNVLLMHICPTVKENLNFKKIEKFILDKIDVNNPDLQGFLLGSVQACGLYSGELFEKFEDFMNKYRIPFSKFQGSEDYSDVAYSSTTDEWLICSPKSLKNQFRKIEISDLDEIV